MKKIERKINIRWRKLFLPGKEKVKEFLKNLKLNENQLSNVLTVVVVVLVGTLLINYFRGINRVDREKTTSASTEQTQEQKQAMSVEEVVKSGLPSEYTVKPGDSLWKIAETAYGSGYDWNEVYQANRESIKNPSVIPVGLELTLPKLEEKVVDHTVVKGESLWSISASVCGNGFLWEKVAADNSIPNPRVIEPGMILTVRCR